MDPEICVSLLTLAHAHMQVACSRDVCMFYLGRPLSVVQLATVVVLESLRRECW